MRLIDADALFENLDGMMAVSPTGYIHGDTVADMIGDAPTVDAEPVKHGYWRNYKDEHTCSCCGETVTGDWYDKDNDAYWHCPWCGAKMDEEREEE